MCRDRKQVSGCLGVGLEWELTGNDYKETLGDCGKVLRVGCGGHTSV